jgi:uncharacterized membrane protein
MGNTVRSRPKTIGRWIFGVLFILAGIGHFVRPEIYMKIMPDYLPYHRELVLISGAFESALGLMLLIPTTRRLAAWGLIALLIAIFPANLDMFLHPEKSGLSPVALAIRLPIQGLLILWAWAYTGPDQATVEGP